MANDMQACVLYVDDEINNLKALKRLFKDQPFAFVTYASPIDALRSIDKLNPAVVIADQHMPGMTGTDFLEQVTHRQPDTIRMILTGHADFESAVEAINKGHVYSYIEKPWDDEDLMARVNAALEHRDAMLCLHHIVDVLADEIVENQKDHKAIQKLAGAVDNDLSQPLMIISGYTKLLKDLIRDDEIPNRYLSNIMLQLRRIEMLKDKVRSISRRLAVSHGYHSQRVRSVLGSCSRDKVNLGPSSLA